MLALLLSFALPAQAAWTETGRGDGCVFYKGQTEESGVMPVRAVCDWEIAPAVLQKMLANSAEHAAYFSRISKCDVLKKDGADDIAWQLHETSGLAPREVVLRMGVEDIAGGKRFTWTKHTDQSYLSGKSVEVALNTGKWEITDGANTGAHVVYELRYLAGGRVPGLMVRWFQGAGMQQLVGELRKAAIQRQ